MATSPQQIKWALGMLIIPIFAATLAILAHREKTKAKPLIYRPDSELAALEQDPRYLVRGVMIYQMRCVVCHGLKGEGKVGANLTDDYWLHGNGDTASILMILRKGVLPQGMPAWENVVEPEDLTAAAIYVRSLRGSNPQSAKAPQGQLIQK